MRGQNSGRVRLKKALAWIKAEAERLQVEADAEEAEIEKKP
ncbi:hypothetical protein [Neisseria wadsworthii]|uniref:Uncharacterized protein n=1 Tax=Neisseria wadsworthii 9715 TaxID=1030841 RepID=G4CP00_9NEIS|nr:hypothetical protein [Neisseria wadsworthii]EGZ48514.1 hypothetical protein HMPREF9370_0809 [Neisseria wadsworthii 9715]